MNSLRIIIAFGLIAGGISSCKLFSDGDKDVRGSAIIEKEREVTRDGNSGKLFDILTGKSTGIDFNNDLTENYQVNFWRYSYIYQGGGVCIGDVNKDGLDDLFFTGNMVPNKLYLNKGNLKFEDITAKSGITTAEWDFNYGASMVDVDGDNDLDIYVCLSRWDDPKKRINKLWINKGDATFEEKAKEAGLADESFSTHANFFDYDNDGDLDMYLATHPIDFIDKNKTKYFQKIEQGKNLSNMFYVNNGDGTWTESHLKVGINNHGYGLSATVADLNDDGFLDVFVANDYAMYDFIYMNNGNGTFRDESLKAIRKTSINAMGVDISDFNNDGYQDIFTTDMDMEDNYTYKTFQLASQVEVMRVLINAGYGYQNRSNSLQLNNGDATFSEISRSAGVSTTDWSWSTFFTDFDNDGWKDLYVANGYPRDFHIDENEAYHKLRRAIRIADSTVYYEVRKEIPTYVLDHPDYIYKNNGDLTFEDMRDKWGIYYPSITYGGGYSDLDNDGDMDIVACTVNETPWIYRNNAEKIFPDHTWIQFRFKGYAKNTQGLGTKVKIYVGDQIQFIQHTSSRGYITTLENDCHFGLGTAAKVDLVEIEWQDGTKQILRDVASNQVVLLDHANASKDVKFEDHKKTAKIFENKTAALKTDFKHVENDFDDFLREFNLPHKMSSLGPGIAVADVNGDGLDDFYIGGAMNQSGALYFQNADGTFANSGWAQNNGNGLECEDAGVLFFDADGDKDQDLYVATGGSEYAANDPKYADRLYKNDGTGKFSMDQNAIPKETISGSVVTAADYDKDGDLDLFVGGRQKPGEYLEPVSSSILQNNNGKFTDVASTVAPVLQNIGMVSSALWTDFDGDASIDLILTGDWMPITFLKNTNGKFSDITSQTGLQNSTGWWQSITGSDLDSDGDMDYVVGNFGTNRRFKNTTAVADGHALPFEAYLNDYDGNGTKDLILAYYQHDKLFPVKTRERMLEQIPSVGKDFPTWDDYGKATVQDLFGEAQLQKSIHRSAYIFNSSVLINDGNGKFTMKFLPNEAQISTIFGMVADDFNEDGMPDILLHGNFYNTEIEVTRHDAGTGLLLIGQGDGTFTPMRGFESGFKSAGDAKGLATILTGSTKQPAFLIGNSNGFMQSYGLIDQAIQTIEFTSTDAYAIVTYKDGKKNKVELYNGSGYLSQSAKYIRITPMISSIEVFDYAGANRMVYPGTTASK